MVRPIDRRRAYGLSIHSELCLPELPPTRDPADIRVTLGAVAPPAAAAAPEWEVNGDEARGAYGGIGRFLVSRGREIVVDPDPAAAAESLQPFLLGPALAVALHQRGYRVLHASAVAIGGVAFGFLGHAGSGKSTLAAALRSRGHRPIADDVVALRPESGGFVPLPGLPWLKLWPPTAEAIGITPEELPRVRPDLAKRSWAAAEPAAPPPTRVDRLYVLAEGPHVASEPIGAAESVIELARHTYGARSLHGVRAESHLQEAAELARAITLRRLRRPWRLGDLATAVELVEREAAT